MIEASTPVDTETKVQILRAARLQLLAHGFAGLSTRKVAEAAGIHLSQIHYHFGSKHKLILEVLRVENERLLERQAEMFGSDDPLWRQWEDACDYLEEDLASGYVRVLNEIIAAGWSDEELAGAVRKHLVDWFDLLTSVATRVQESFGGFGPFTAREVASLAGLSFLGAETVILLGTREDVIPARAALRKLAPVIRGLEERGG